MRRALIIAASAFILTLALAGAVVAAPLNLCGDGKFVLYADNDSIGARYGITNNITIGGGTAGTDDGFVLNGRWQATRTLLVAADYYLLPDTSAYDLLKAGAYLTLASGGNVVLVAGGGIDYYLRDGGDSSISLFGLAEVQFNISSRVVFYQSFEYVFDTDSSSLDFGDVGIGLQYSFGRHPPPSTGLSRTRPNRLNSPWSFGTKNRRCSAAVFYLRLDPSRSSLTRLSYILEMTFPARVRPRSRTTS